MIADSIGSGVVETETEFHDALANERRRRALTALREADEPLLLTDLARDVAQRETSDGTGRPADETVQRCRISLYHSHLPKLAAAGLLTFDADEKEAVLTDDGRLVA